MDEKEKLIRQVFMIQRERGFQQFHAEFFACRDAVRLYPNPDERTLHLREHWDRLSEEEYPGFRKSFGPLSVKKVSDHLETVKMLVDKTLHPKKTPSVPAYAKGREM